MSPAAVAHSAGILHRRVCDRVFIDAHFIAHKNCSAVGPCAREQRLQLECSPVALSKNVLHILSKPFKFKSHYCCPTVPPAARCFASTTRRHKAPYAGSKPRCRVFWKRRCWRATRSGCGALPGHQTASYWRPAAVTR